ncbi:MAG: hypothetical protein ACXWCY_05515 [Burkholderiales bacterium]
MSAPALASSVAATRRNAYIGTALTIIGSIAFAGKPIIIKLAYHYDVDVMTLLALRMLFSLPFFLRRRYGQAAHRQL